ncbi:hypothetical protein GCM10008170_04180 [Methylopila capsulata]|uniref:Uncharacterized protein n=1 Tax=Methylopila capsulata TaxID=61654 RepID=A0A9W6IS71_9HYPH|nr:hypothetical protein GCM10008170_04180 [Methylopila capsulata]
MRSLDLIPKKRLINIPAKFHAEHEFCFYLHDVMATILKDAVEINAEVISFNVDNQEDAELIESGISIFDYFDKTNRNDLALRLSVTSSTLPLSLICFIFCTKDLKRLRSENLP